VVHEKGGGAFLDKAICHAPLRGFSVTGDCNHVRTGDCVDEISGEGCRDINTEGAGRKSGYVRLRRMASSGMLLHVALVRTEVSEELRASIIRVTRIGVLGTTLAVTSNRITQRRNTKH
jgi:hypothetical protein